MSLGNFTMFKYGLVRGATLGAAIFVALAGFAGTADAQKKGGSVKKKAVERPLTKEPWLKLCNKVAINPKKPKEKKKICVTTAADIHPLQGSINGSISFTYVEGKKEPRLEIMTPLGRFLPAGVELAIDNAKKGTRFAYLTCVGNCLAVGQPDEKFISSLKKGKVISIRSVDTNNRGFRVDFLLDNFAKALAGAPMDPKAFAKNQKKLSQLIQANRKRYNESVKAAKKKAAAKKKN